MKYLCLIVYISVYSVMISIGTSLAADIKNRSVDDPPYCNSYRSAAMASFQEWASERSPEKLSLLFEEMDIVSEECDMTPAICFCASLGVERCIQRIKETIEKSPWYICEIAK
jgi:hypothetical protein